MSVKRLINDSSRLLRQVMEMGLETAAEQIISQRVKEFNNATPSKESKAISKSIEKGMSNYRLALKDALTVIANDARSSAKKELKGVDFKFAELKNKDLFELLPFEVRNRIDAQATLLSRTQFADLQKEIDFQYLSSQPATSSPAVIRMDLEDAAESYVSGPAVSSGSVSTAASTVNETRNQLFFEPEVLDQVEAFEFVNGDPVSAICQNLAGKVFRKDDPEAAQFYPPLHFNCKSYIRPLLRVPKNKEVVRLRPTTQKARNAIQFHENKLCC